jgi:hypothetical protein
MGAGAAGDRVKARCASVAAALLGFGHAGIVALMIVAALASLMASLIELTLEIRVHLATMALD